MEGLNRSTFFAFNVKGNYPRALEAALNLQKVAEQPKDNRIWAAGAWYFIGLLNREMADYPNAIVQLHKAILSQQQAETQPTARDIYSQTHNWDFVFANKSIRLCFALCSESI